MKVEITADWGLMQRAMAAETEAALLRAAIDSEVDRCAGLAAEVARLTGGGATEQLHTFLNAAAGEGFVLDGVDAADLYVAMFPERYAATLASIEDESDSSAVDAPEAPR